jgi:predicted transcriptional regulator
MTNLLTEVMRKVVELPEDRQDDAARVLMLMLEHDPEQYRLSDEQLREVEAASADVDAGNYVTEEEINRVLHHS